MGYIYKITNDINGKIYIGKTEYFNPYDRWKDHLRDYKKERCEKRPIYDAMNKYGEEHFYFEIIEETDNLEEREIYWINELRTYIGFEDCKGYNATLGGDGKSYIILNEDEVINYHIFDGNYVVAKTAQHFQTDRKRIKTILKKNNIIWLNNADSNRLKTYEKNGGVYQLTKENKIILNIFENAKEANVYLGNKKNNSTIYNTCNRSLDESHSAYGYLWYYGRDIQYVDYVKYL